MTDHYQYRMIVGDSIGPVTETAQQWSHTAEHAEERGYPARLERRLVTDTSICAFFPDGLPCGWMMIGNTVATAWELWAEVRNS